MGKILVNYEKYVIYVCRCLRLIRTYFLSTYVFPKVCGIGICRGTSGGPSTVFDVIYQSASTCSELVGGPVVSSVHCWLSWTSGRGYNYYLTAVMFQASVYITCVSVFCTPALKSNIVYFDLCTRPCLLHIIILSLWILFYSTGGRSSRRCGKNAPGHMRA